MEKDIKVLYEKVERLEREVEFLKKQNRSDVELDQTASSVNVVSKKPPQKSVKEVPKSVPPVKEKIPKIPSKPKKTISFEEVLGTWLPRVFMFILLLGVLWGLKVGVDNGWITNPMRVILGYGGAIALYFIGYRYYIGKSKAFGLTLLGGFVALGMITTFAAHHIYGFFNFGLAFIINLLIVVMGIYLSNKLKSETIMMFSAIGGFLIPFLLENNQPDFLLFGGYILVLFISLLYLAVKNKHKVSLYIIFILFHLTLVAYNLFNYTIDYSLHLGLAVFIQHVALLYTHVFNKQKENIFSETLLYLNFAFSSLWFLSMAQEHLSLITFGLSVIYILSFIEVKKRNLDRLKSIMLALSVLAVGFFIVTFNFDNEYVKPLLFVLSGTTGLWIAFHYKSIRSMITSGFMYFLISMYVLFGISIDPVISMGHLVWIVWLASIVVVYYAVYAKLLKNYKIPQVIVDASLVYGQIATVVYALKLSSPLLQSVSDTVHWDVYIGILTAIVFTLAFIWILVTKDWAKGRFIRYISVIQIAFAGSILLSIPIHMVNGDKGFYTMLAINLLFINILINLLMLFKKKGFALWEGKFKIPTGIVATIYQIVGIILVNKIYLNTMNFFEVDTSILYFLHTLLLIVIAFISISVGGKFNWKTVRILGFIMLAISIVKLFFVDLVQVSLVIRALLFIIVGIVGIWYSRTLIKK